MAIRRFFVVRTLATVTALFLAACANPSDRATSSASSGATSTSAASVAGTSTTTALATTAPSVAPQTPVTGVTAQKPADRHSWLFRDGEAVVWSDGTHLFERSFSVCGSNDELQMVTPPIGSIVHSLDELNDAPTEEKETCSGRTVGVRLSGWSLLAPWKPRPRPVTIGVTEAAVYNAEAKRVLSELGAGPVTISTARSARADLDGDGTDEVIVAATSASPPDQDWDPREASVVFVRTVRGSGVETTALAARVPRRDDVRIVRFGEVDLVARYDADDFLYAGSFRADIGTIADLDGDATMEVVIPRGYWEGGDVSIWRITAGSTPRRIGLAA
jgi:hypothetical protein